MAIQKFSIGPNGFYKFDANIKLKMFKSFPNKDKEASNARFLHFHNGKIFITDLGLHKMYIIDLKTGEQTIHGFFGSNPGQFSKPTGLISDDRYTNVALKLFFSSFQIDQKFIVESSVGIL